MGFRIVGLLSKTLGVRLMGRRFQSRQAIVSYKGKRIILLCPSTFMNLSGKSISQCADFYHLELEEIVIVYDDLDLPVGRIKIARRGGAGGHKGVQSIIDHFGTTLFPRVKIGIGRPRRGESIEDYVLSPFYEDQEDMVTQTVELAVKACQLLILNGVEAAMNQINSSKIEDKEV
jgi:PTH1 family peptidyl-tRNA hydrolase